MLRLQLSPRGVQSNIFSIDVESAAVSNGSPSSLIYFLLMLRVQLSPKVVQSNLLSSDDESAAVSKGSPVDQFSLNWEEKLIENLNEVIRTILGQGFSLIVHVW